MLIYIHQDAAIKILQVSSINEGVEDQESPYISTNVLENWMSTKGKYTFGRWPPNQQ